MTCGLIICREYLLTFGSGSFGFPYAIHVSGYEDRENTNRVSFVRKVFILSHVERAQAEQLPEQGAEEEVCVQAEKVTEESKKILNENFVFFALQKMHVFLG